MRGDALRRSGADRVSARSPLGVYMQLLRILGRSLVDSFCQYVLPLVSPGGDYAGDLGRLPHEAQELFEAAIELARESELADARRMLEQAAELAGGHIGVGLLLAAVRNDLGQAAAAREIIDGLLVDALDDGRMWFLCGQLAERCGEVDRAIECYRETVERGGRPSCDGAERLAALYLAAEDFEGARRMLVWLSEARPEEFRVRLELAGVCAAMGDHVAAVLAYQDAILLEPDDWEAHKDLAASLEAEGHYYAALAELRLVLDEHPGFADVQFRAARLCVRLGDLCGALRHVDAALEANPRYLEAITLKGTLLTERGEYRAAIATFHRAIQISDDYLGAYAGLALALERSGDDTMAAETLELARSIAPGSESIYAKLSNVGLMAALQRDADADPGDPGVLGSDRLRCDRAGGAPAAGGSDDDTLDYDARMRLQMEKHLSAIERFPRYADLRYYYGLLLASLGREAEALEQFRAAVEINPHYTEALVRLAMGYWKAGRADETRHALEKASAAPRRDLNLHYRFALMWSDRGLWPLIVESFGGGASDASSAHALHGGMVSAMQNVGVSDPESRRYMAELRLADKRDLHAPHAT